MTTPAHATPTDQPANPDREIRQNFGHAMKPALGMLIYGLACWGALTLINPALNPLSLHYLPPVLILLGVLAVHAISVWSTCREAPARKAEQERLANLELAQQFGCELITLTDTHGRIRYISPSLERLSGHTLADVIGKNVNLFKSGENPPSVYSNLWSTILAGQTWQGTLLNSAATGELYYEKKRIAPTRDAQGMTTGYASCGQDVTAEIRATESLRQSEDRFAQAMRSGHDAIWDWNLETDSVYYSPSWKAMLGYKEDEVVHHLDFWRERVHEDDNERVLNLARAYVQHERKEFEVEFRMRHKNGSWRTLNAQVISAPGRDNVLGGAKRLIGTCVDVTEMRRVEGEIRLLSRALAAVQNGVIITDACKPDMPAIYINKAFTTLTGYSPNEVLGKNCRFLQGPDTLQPELETLRAALAANKPAIATLKNYRKDGQVFWNHFHLAPVLNDDGVLTHHIGILEDVTHAHEAEQLMHRANDALISTYQIKSQFMAKMSHELRTPMNGVLGMNQLLMDTELNKEQREYVEVIDTSGSEMLALVEDILAYASLDAPINDSEKTPFPPNEIATWISRPRRKKIEAKGLQLNVTLGDGVPEFCLGEPQKLRQALHYLIDNAIKFTPAGQIDIHVSQAEPDMLTIEVRDTGVGISPEQLNTIFDAFQQADNSHTRSYGGIGLGLTLCRGLVENMGGTMMVESTLGAGSLFRITLPAPKVELDAFLDENA